MYEHNGERYFIVDGHVHYWNAAPDNWVEGQEKYAKGWIDCFYAYHGLGPEEAHWPYEQYQRYDAELMMRHLFEEGHVDLAIFQPTYLKQWYIEGFNTTERNAILAEKHPDRFVVNGAWDPRAVTPASRSSRPRSSGTASRASSSTRRSGEVTPGGGA